MKEKRFQIICRTDLYNASRLAGFNSHTGIKVIKEYETLKEANNAMLDMANDAYESDFSNWGLLCISRKKSVFVAGTHSDGTRYFNEDIYNYSVEEK